MEETKVTPARLLLKRPQTCAHEVPASRPQHKPLPPPLSPLQVPSKRILSLTSWEGKGPGERPGKQGVGGPRERGESGEPRSRDQVPAEESRPTRRASWDHRPLLRADPRPVVLQLLQHHIRAAVPGHHRPGLSLCHRLQLPDQGQLWGLPAGRWGGGLQARFLASER